MNTIKHPYELPLFSNHRWSGWPGALCYYCFQSDPLELQLNGLGDGRDTTCPATDAVKLNVDRVMNPSLYGFKGACLIETWGPNTEQMAEAGEKVRHDSERSTLQVSSRSAGAFSRRFQAQ